MLRILIQFGMRIYIILHVKMCYMSTYILWSSDLSFYNYLGLWIESYRVT